MNNIGPSELPVSQLDDLSLERGGARPTVVIRPSRGIFDLNLWALWEYRELFFFLVWRDVKARYAQSILGIGWAIVQPVFSMLVFTVIFGGLAQISSDGSPYAIFSYTALVPWTYFANTLSEITGSLIRHSNLLQKVYFPRLIIALVPILGKLIDFSIAFTLLIGLMFWFKVTPTAWVVALPLLIFMMMLTSAGIGMWFTALAIQYRDINYGMRFAIQLMMYAAPVVYPTSLIPEPYRLWYGINPMAGVIEGFRASLLGSIPMPWDLIAVGGISAVSLFVGGLLYFSHKERIFADVA